MGINVNRTISFTFALGGALAGAAGVLYLQCSAPTRYDLGFQLGLIAFTAAVLGGIGNLTGAVSAACSSASSRASTRAAVGLGQKWSQTVVFAILILLMVFKPEGSSAGRRRRRCEPWRPSTARRVTGPPPRAASSTGFALAARLRRRGRRSCSSSTSSSCRSLVDAVSGAVIALAAARIDQRGADLGDLRARPQHRRRLRRPARPRVRGVLGHRRLHRRLADVRAPSTGLELPLPRLRCPATARHPHQLLARADRRRRALRVLRHHHRRADAAAAQRLPGARHAGLRRDHPEVFYNGDDIGGLNLTNGTQGITPIDPIGIGPSAPPASRPSC